MRPLARQMRFGLPSSEGGSVDMERVELPGLPLPDDLEAARDEDDLFAAWAG